VKVPLFLHGSYTPHEAGFQLKPRGEDYARDWEGSDFYAALEYHRPEGLRSHRQSVFLCTSVEDVELAGGATDFLLLVEPEEPNMITRHDVNWSTEISMLIGDGFHLDSPEVKEAALNYWSGEPHENECVWEYLCSGALVMECFSSEDLQIEALDRRVKASHTSYGFRQFNEELSGLDDLLEHPGAGQRMMCP
jgi:hypothetical protein